MYLNLTNDSEVTIVQSCQYYWKFLFEPKEVTYRLRNLSLMKVRFGETLNSEVVENSIRFLKRVETQNFGTERRNHEGWNLIGLSRYDFESESIFLSFFWFFRICFLSQYECMMSCNMSTLYVPHQKKILCQIWLTYSRW
jgi:hypothetical protein